MCIRDRCGSIYDGLIQVQHRGQDAVGISTWDKTKMYLHKDTGLVTEVFKTDNSLSQLNGNIGIGHVRYPTAGGNGKEFSQPMYVNSPYGISLAHNGNLTNSKQLSNE